LEEINGGPLSEGPHTLNPYATDQLGNMSSIVEIPFTLDTIDPTITSFELDPAFDSDPLGDLATNQDVVSLIGQTEPNTVVELNESGDTTISDANGDFRFDDVSLPASALAERSKYPPRSLRQAGSIHAVDLPVG